MTLDSNELIVGLLKDISQQTDSFASATGLRCKEGCGKCCENPEVETTVAEVMPMAMHLWEAGKAQEIWDTIEARKEAATGKDYRQGCVFYKPDPTVPGNGRCSIYEFRPGICRLFGFAYKRGKNDKKELVTCRVMKEHFPAECASAQAHLDAGQPAPSISDHGMKVQVIDPGWGGKLLPINRAIQTALERIGLIVGREGP